MTDNLRSRRDWDSTPDNSDHSTPDHSDDSGFIFDDSGSEDADGVGEYPPRRQQRRYVLVSEHATLEDAKQTLDTHNAFVYTYETRYETDRLHARVYRCRSHVMCDHRLKLVCVVDETPTYQLAAGGSHGATSTGVARRGIDSRIRDEVDGHLRMGYGALQLRTVLQQRHAENPAMLALIPSTRQLENRKAYLMRSVNSGWDLRDYATFNAWASTRMCTTREQFFEVTDPQDPRIDALLIIAAFVIEGANGDDDGPTFGVVATSRRVFRNVATAVRDQGTQLGCATDGTYKLHFGGWTVVDCGTETVVWRRQTFAHQFVPWVYMFVRSETTEAYARMFEAVRDRARLFFDVDVNIIHASLDHSEAIASAFLRVWPRVKLLTCWPDLMRQARKKRILLTDPEAFDDMIKPHLTVLRSSRSHAQFLKMSIIFTTHRIKQGEREYTSWFRSVYLVQRWDRWHVNGAGVGGVIPSQQGIEAHHRVIKRTCAPSSRASTGGVMNGILPRILRMAGETASPQFAAQYASGPVPPEMLLKDQRLTDDASNYRRVHRGNGRRKKLIGLVFNSGRHIVDGSNILAATVDEG